MHKPEVCLPARASQSIRRHLEVFGSGAGSAVAVIAIYQRGEQKKPSLGGWAFRLVGLHGLEPWTKGFITLRLSPLKQLVAARLCAGLSHHLLPRTLKRSRWSGVGRSGWLLRRLNPSTSLCTFWNCSSSLAQGCHAYITVCEGFPEFTRFFNRHFWRKSPLMSPLL